jgi:hypothetical protein
MQKPVLIVIDMLNDFLTKWASADRDKPTSRYRSVWTLGFSSMRVARYSELPLF